MTMMGVLFKYSRANVLEHLKICHSTSFVCLSAVAWFHMHNKSKQQKQRGVLINAHTTVWYVFFLKKIKYIDFKHKQRLADVIKPCRKKAHSLLVDRVSPVFIHGWANSLEPCVGLVFKRVWSFVCSWALKRPRVSWSMGYPCFVLWTGFLYKNAQ